MKLLRNHPVTLVCYIFYVLLCYKGISFSLKFNAAFDQQPNDSFAYGNQGQLFAMILTSIVAIIFIVIMILNAALRKTGKNFYWWMCLFIALPLFALAAIIYLSIG